MDKVMATSWTTDSEDVDLGTEDLLARVRSVLDGEDMCVLGTLEGCGSRLTPCFFGALRGLGLVFVSSRGSRHVKNMEADRRCSALVVIPPAGDGSRLVSLQAIGRVCEPRGRRRLAALRAFAGRAASHLPAAASGISKLMDKRVFVLEPDRIEFLDTGLSRESIVLRRSWQDMDRDAA